MNAKDFFVVVGAVIAGNILYRKFIAPHMHLILSPHATLPAPSSALVSIQTPLQMQPESMTVDAKA